MNVSISKARHKREILSVLFASVLSWGILIGIGYLVLIDPGMQLLLGLVSRVTGTTLQIPEHLLLWGRLVLAAAVAAAVLTGGLRAAFMHKAYTGKLAATEKWIIETGCTEIIQRYVVFLNALRIYDPPSLFVCSEEEKRKHEQYNSSVIAIPESLLREAMESGDYLHVEFLVAQRLAQIVLGHCTLRRKLLLFPARMIPALYPMVSRNMTYSADRLTAMLMGRERAAAGIVRAAYSKSRFPDAEKAMYRRMAISKTEASGLRLYNLMCKEPPVPLRVAALMNSRQNSAIESKQGD